MAKGDKTAKAMLEDAEAILKFMNEGNAASLIRIEKKKQLNSFLMKFD